MTADYNVGVALPSATLERPQAAIEIEHIHKHHIAASEAGALRFVPPSAAFHLLM